MKVNKIDNIQIQKLMLQYEEKIHVSQSAAEVATFFQLLFNESDCIQFKVHKKVKAVDATYVLGSEIQTYIPGLLGRFSDDGYRYCCNPIPAIFQDKLWEIGRYESMGDYLSDHMAEKLKDELSLSCDLFTQGRTFFIEADNDSQGQPIETIEAKIQVLSELLGTGLPFSFIVDTGGRGPHIGIVLEEDIPLREFDLLVHEVKSRLPSWLDMAVGKVNQLGRLPGTFRVNKNGEKVQVKTIFIGERVSNKALTEWINNRPIINFAPRTLNDEKDEFIEDIDLDELEQAAMDFIEVHGLRHGKLRNGKIRVSCPNGSNHKKGVDKDMDAFINIETGLVYCKACQKKVGETFRRQRKLIQSQLFPTQADTEELSDITYLKSTRKLF